MNVDPKLYVPTAQRRAKRNPQVPPMRSPTAPPSIKDMVAIGLLPAKPPIFTKRERYVIAGMIAAVILLSASAAFF